MDRKGALRPGQSSVAVPPRWSKLRVSQQGEDDYACGLHCIVTAARYLGSIQLGAGPRRLLGALAPGDATRIDARLAAVGLFEKDVRALAAAVGLGVYRPNMHDAGQFKEPGWLWMAFVLMRFAAPDGSESNERHYVLVLDYLADHRALVVADPHPWNPPVYCVALQEFESAWRAARAKGPPWAAALYKRA